MKLIVKKLLNLYIFKTAWDIILSTKDQMLLARLFMVASSLAYTTILSIIPVLAVSFAIFNAFGGMQKLYGLVEPLILSNLAQGTSKEVMETLHKFIDNAHTGAVGITGFVGLVFTSMSMLSSIEQAINLVWQSKIKRSLFHRIAAYWLFITLGPLALSVAVGIASSSNVPIYRLLPSGTGLYLISIGIFFSTYKWVPSVYVKPRYALISAVITAGLWNLARFGYTYYTQNIVSYSKVYGSLGAVPILLLWIYIVWVIILGGAALTAALQKQSG